METSIEKIVNELVDVKTELKLLQIKERDLKSQIEPLIKLGESITIPSAEIFCAVRNAKQYVSRVDLLDFLIENYGEDVAENVDKWCTKTRESSRNVRVKLKGENG